MHPIVYPSGSERSISATPMNRFRRLVDANDRLFELFCDLFGQHPGDDIGGGPWRKIDNQRDRFGRKIGRRRRKPNER